MIKNILIYLMILISAFVFNIFFYAWFSWYLLVLTLCIPFFSLVCSLPFMISCAVKGLSVSTPKEITIGDKLNIGIASKNGKTSFCPLVRVNFKISNSFTGRKRHFKFIYGGFIKKPVYKKVDRLSHDCGCLNISARYCKIYDLLGIFFIPIKLNCNNEVLIKPKAKEPSILPDLEHIKIIGYKPKTSGFAEEYELRNYQRGDSLKSIHWKISARHNNLIVKEPSEPVHKLLILKPVITQNAKENNSTLGKFIYLTDFILKSDFDFYCASPDNEICQIKNQDDVRDFLLHLYKKQSLNQAPLNMGSAITYTITHNGEAVSE